MAAIAGISNGLLLAFINMAAEQAGHRQIESRLFLMYLITFALMIYSERYAQKITIAAVEKALQQIRLRIIHKVCDVDLRFIEQAEGVSSFSPLLQGVNYISESVREVIQMARESLLLIVACIYVLWLSPPTFFLVVLFLAISIPIGIYYYKKTDEEMEKMEEFEEGFSSHFEAILSGFKELKVNHAERDAVLEQLQKMSVNARDLRTNANIHLMNEGLLSHIMMYTLIVVAIFIIPQFLTESSTIIHQITAAILFLLGPAAMLASSLPGASKASHVISTLYKLEERLDQASKQSASVEHQAQKKFTQFKKITLRDVEFDYRDTEQNVLFEAGPFDLDVHAGELLFIVGGNGSGKSTFLKLLTGLYVPQKGTLLLDDRKVAPETYTSYRSLFSLVFTDFHLFDELHGLPDDVSEAEVNHWIKKLGLQHKTEFRNGRFTNIELSTGQRKRLAFIVAVLKRRPVCIFDELAADQDPVFRRLFYQEILPELRGAGRTVIVVTHDENYFGYCDRMVRMEDGRIAK